MKRLILILLFSLLPISALGQSVRSVPPACTVAQLTAGTCAPEKEGARAWISNCATSTDCSSAGSSTTLVEYDGTDWIPRSGIVHVRSFCGRLIESGTIYMGPLGIGKNDTISVTGDCDADALSNESAIDTSISNELGAVVTGMWCRTDATLGSGETITYTFDNDTTATSTTCVISEGETSCASNVGFAGISAGAPVAVKAVESSNNSDDDGWCSVTFLLGD